MKKLIVLVFIIQVSINGFCQLNPAGTYKVANITAPFNVNVPVGTTIIQADNGDEWICMYPTNGGHSLYTAQAYFRLSNAPAPYVPWVIDRWGKILNHNMQNVIINPNGWEAEGNSPLNIVQDELSGRSFELTSSTYSRNGVYWSSLDGWNGFDGVGLFDIGGDMPIFNVWNYEDNFMIGLGGTGDRFLKLDFFKDEFTAYSKLTMHNSETSPDGDLTWLGYKDDWNGVFTYWESPSITQMVFGWNPFSELMGYADQSITYHGGNTNYLRMGHDRSINKISIKALDSITLRGKVYLPQIPTIFSSPTYLLSWNSSTKEVCISSGYLWNNSNGVITTKSPGDTVIMQRVSLPNGVIDVGDTVYSYGNSITTGVGASDPSLSFTSLIAKKKHWKNINRATNGYELADIIKYNIYPNLTKSNQISLGLFGYNDMSHYGNNATFLTCFKRQIYSAAVWLSIPFENIQLAQTYAVKTGTWTNLSIYGGGKTIASNENGSTATFSVTGTTVYVDIIQSLNESRGINVNIDGVDYGTFEGHDFTITRNAVSGYAPYLIRVPGLRDGIHEVVLTVTNGTGYAYINYCAGNAGTMYDDACTLYLGNCLRMNADGYATAQGTPPQPGAGSDDAVYAINNIIEQCAADLADDGLNIAYVDANAYYNTETCVHEDNIHPNDLGYSRIASAFLSQMNSASQARGKGVRKSKNDNLWITNTDGNYIQRDTSKNVGIGTIEPLCKVDIDGDVRIQSNHKLYFGNTSSPSEENYITKASAGGGVRVYNLEITNPGAFTTVTNSVLGRASDQSIQTLPGSLLTRFLVTTSTHDSITSVVQMVDNSRTANDSIYLPDISNVSSYPRGREIIICNNTYRHYKIKVKDPANDVIKFWTLGGDTEIDLMNKDTGHCFYGCITLICVKNHEWAIVSKNLIEDTGP